MTRLGAVVAEAIVIEYGRDEFLRRLAHPFWFQSSGAVMGMDWHSSGITTSVLGALKRGLAPLSREFGIHVCGGRGRHSRATPAELAAVGERTGLDSGALARASRLVAKVDSAAIQDGFDLDLHGFIVTDDGRWVVVQQGMNGERLEARRDHWQSEGLESFVDSPHAAIDGPEQGSIVNLADRRAAASRQRQLSLLGHMSPGSIVREFGRLTPSSRMTGPEAEADQPLLPHLSMPTHHEARPETIVEKRLHGALAAAAERGPKDFAELLLVPGVGARTMFSLALVAEVLHGTPCRFTDPARFSLAHGGKDRNPYPVPTRVYDQAIRALKSAVTKARLGSSEELAALARLDEQARRLEATAGGPTVNAFIAEEKKRSHAYGGRSVFGWEPALTGETRSRLFPNTAAGPARRRRVRLPCPRRQGTRRPSAAEHSWSGRTGLEEQHACGNPPHRLLGDFRSFQELLKIGDR